MSDKDDLIDVCVELVDEGTESWRLTQARPVGEQLPGERLYQLLPVADYDPEDESWAFLPGDIVRIEPLRFGDGRMKWAARHPDPGVVRIDMEVLPGGSLMRAHALALGNDLYRVLPLSDVRLHSGWKFPPGSIVRLKEIRSKDNLFTYRVATEAE